MATIECVCPPKNGEVRHPKGDTVRLRQKLGFREAVQARNVIVLLKQDDPDADVADILGALTEVYLLVGIESWTLTDEKGRAIEPTRPAIRQFMADHTSEAMDIGEEADTLYSEAVVLPLVARAARSSQPSQTDDSTSVMTGSPVPLRRSKRSSTTSSQTDDTGMMPASLGGVSN
jgi:hypothetical protein